MIQEWCAVKHASYIHKKLFTWVFVTAGTVVIVHVGPMSVMAELLASNTMVMGKDMEK